ncbi:hypothetical protein RBH29_04320 [Herbivorax sp. ANBcel31]|uniref:hypothetical protein n=1 Tax=Herbivorax sp. ANBcel31 TaxID=3069754 RepID=UPI0027B55719|nr:hypothetical protein [Herbivorax sp. ANBcel31]MDQ2085658.1 hypothetical protein [Herbivorax sp. ANBcel31]
MKRIEFIGAPAVGKSTVLQEVLKMRRNNDKWLTPGEAMVKIAKSINYKKSILFRIIHLCLKLNLMKSQQVNMASIILKKHDQDVLSNVQEKYNDIANLYVNELFKNENINSIHKLKLSSSYFNILFKEIMVLDYYQLDNLVIYDEGIIHNNSAFKNEELCGQVLKKHIDDKSDVIPRGIIYCYMEEKQYLERRKKRINNGKKIIFDMNLKNDQFEEMCIRALKRSEDKIKVLENYDVPILKIHMSQSIQENTKYVYDFIKNM